MMSNVRQLYPQSSPISQIIRVGHTGHRMLEDLFAAQRVPIRHAVIDASHARSQRDLLHCLSGGGAELTLDTKSAELSTPSGIVTRSRELPWAQRERPTIPFDYQGQKGRDIAEKIAEFALDLKANTVLSPSHFLATSASEWLLVDFRMCEQLRDAFDRLDGRHIRIDSHISLPISLLRDHQFLDMLSERLSDAPIENIWLRVSNFGMNGSPAGSKSYIEAAWLLSRTGKPIIADLVSGAIGIGLASFGAVGGISHGIAEKDSFSEANWRRPGSGGSHKKRIYLPALDLYLSQDQAELFLSGRGAKSLALCTDCCRGIEGMVTNHAAHALIQTNKQVSLLNEQPELKRPQYFLGEVLGNAERNLRKARKIKLENDALSKKIKQKCDRMNLLHDTLERLHSDTDAIPIAKRPVTMQRYMRKVG